MRPLTIIDLRQESFLETEELLLEPCEKLVCQPLDIERMVVPLLYLLRSRRVGHVWRKSNLREPTNGSPELVLRPDSNAAQEAPLRETATFRLGLADAAHVDEMPVLLFRIREDEQCLWMTLLAQELIDDKTLVGQSQTSGAGLTLADRDIDDLEAGLRGRSEVEVECATSALGDDRWAEGGLVADDLASCLGPFGAGDRRGEVGQHAVVEPREQVGEGAALVALGPAKKLELLLHVLACADVCLVHLKTPSHTRAASSQLMLAPNPSI
jgi:hypothetical protein